MLRLVLVDSIYTCHEKWTSRGARAGEEDEAGHRATDDGPIPGPWVPAVRAELIHEPLFP